MRIIILFAIAFCMVGCGSPHEQNLEFKGFTVERGVYKTKPGWSFVPQDDGTFAVMRDNNSGGIIEACECALEGEGSCDQATLGDDDGTITDIWCVDNGCGFCVGGTTADPDDPTSKIKFRLECVDQPKLSR